MKIYDDYARNSGNPYYTAVNETACEILSSNNNGISSLEDIPYSRIASEAGCSPSTVKKYLDKHYISRVYKMHVQKPQVQIIHNIDDFATKKLKTVSETFGPGFSCHFDNQANELPEAPGIYLITQAQYNIELHQIIYLVKVGKASNLKNRAKSYTTTNPLAIFRDHIVCQNCDDLELSYQNALRRISKAQVGNLEWFIVDEMTYRKICDKGMRAI